MSAPLLDGEAAARVRDAASAIGASLLALDPSKVAGPSWASGSAGLAIAHLHLEGAFPGRGHGEAAQAALERAAAAIGAEPLPVWLYFGVAGIAWTAEHVAAADDGGMDETLARFVASDARRPCELINGLAGLAVHALERPRTPRVDALLEAIARRLVRDATPTRATRDDGLWWLALPEEDPQNPHAAPFASFGLAHGFPGAILALAAILARGVLVEEIRPVLARACATLLDARLPRGRDAWFRAWSDDAGAPARTAWCYGDPGVAWALGVAGRALGDDALVGEAIAIGRHAASRPAHATGVVDAGLCHGAAGLAHVFHRMHRAHPQEPAFATAAREWLARALDLRRGSSASSEDAGVITGDAGIALAFLSALDPEVTGWDRPMFVVDPP